MDLLELFRITSDCLLCGCPVKTSPTKTPDTAKPSSPLICYFCHQRLPVSESACYICGLPINAPNKSQNSNISASYDLPCGQCLKNSPPFSRTINPFRYQSPIDQLISQMKYSSQIHYIPLLSEYLSSSIKKQYQNQALPSRIVAMPLHSRKLSSRGFNQANLIAKQISKTIGIDIVSKGIHRIKNTQAQSGLDSVERKQNVKNAFRIDCKLPKHIALVDDVVTTGMTVSELAKCARKQGAEQIDVWCLARAYEQ